MKATNLGVLFLIELVALAAVGYWASGASSREVQLSSPSSVRKSRKAPGMSTESGSSSHWY